MQISITDQDIFAALRVFLISIVPGATEVVQEQDNQVAMPLGGFVGMNNVGSKRLDTNVVTYAPGTENPGTKSIQAATQYTMQLDFYGPAAGDWANTAQMLFRDEYATNLFPEDIQPLYADDPVQMPLIDGESQYEKRWRMNAVLQYNPVVTVAQDFATELAITPMNVNSNFPV